MAFDEAYNEPEHVEVLIRSIDPSHPIELRYAHAGDAGADLVTTEEVTLKPFERALELEEERLAGEEERLRTEPGYESYSHRHHAYVTRGRYAEQLRRVFELFDRDQVHIIESEDFFARPEEVYEEVLAFLGLPSWLPPSFERHNARDGDPMPEHVRKKLDEYFLPLDEELAKILGRTPIWRR